MTKSKKEKAAFTRDTKRLYMDDLSQRVIESLLGHVCRSVIEYYKIIEVMGGDINLYPDEKREELRKVLDAIENTNRYIDTIKWIKEDCEYYKSW